MNWKLDKERPICAQICEQVCLGIALGEFRQGEKLLSVREIAVAAGVNPNTVQKSFEILESKGILFSQRGSGWYVSEDTSKAKEEIEVIYYEKTLDFFNVMNLLGMDKEAVKDYIAKWNG